MLTNYTNAPHWSLDYRERQGGSQVGRICGSHTYWVNAERVVNQTQGELRKECQLIKPGLGMSGLRVLVQGDFDATRRYEFSSAFQRRVDLRKIGAVA